MTEKQQSAIEQVRAAVAFFDQVKTATPDEKIAVGSDHWEWLELAARSVVAAFPKPAK